MESVIHITVLCVLLNFTIATQEGVIFTTEEGSVVQLTLPRNESVSSVVLWCSQANTSLLLQLGGHYSPNITLTITHAKVWHFGYIHQPTQESPLSFRIPSNNLYVNMDYSRLQQVRVSSDRLVYWTFCRYAHACAMLPPVSTESGGATLYLLAVLGVVCFLLLAALAALVLHTCYRRRSLFHHYEKPNWPLVPPPVPPTIMHRKENSHEKVRDDDTTRLDDTSSVQTCEQRKQLDQQFNRGDKHESLNSLYGLILP